MSTQAKTKLFIVRDLFQEKYLTETSNSVHIKDAILFSTFKEAEYAALSCNFKMANILEVYIKN